jgi:broad specificity phosphatase PhoE
LTKKGPARESGSLLSAEGVARARALGDQLPSAEYVLTGPDRRHVETAIAMGYAVDEMVSWPSGYVSGVVNHHDQWQWDKPFQRYAELLQTSIALQAVAQVHLTHWHRALDQIDNGATALVISSGGSIEPMLVASYPNGRHAEWGTALHQLEGATLAFDGDQCVGAQIQRQTAP